MTISAVDSIKHVMASIRSQLLQRNAGMALCGGMHLRRFVMHACHGYEHRWLCALRAGGGMHLWRFVMRVRHGYERRWLCALRAVMG